MRQRQCAERLCEERGLSCEKDLCSVQYERDHNEREAFLYQSLYDGDTMTKQEKIAFFRELISIQGNVDILCYDAEQHPMGTIDQRANDLVDVFRASGCLDEMYAHGAHSAMPISLGTALGLLWNAVYEKDDDNDNISAVYVMGPVFISEITEAEFTDKVNQSAIPTDVKIKLLRLYPGIPQIPQARHTYNVMMLHYCVTGQRVSLNDIVSSSVGVFLDSHREETGLLGYRILKTEKRLLSNVTSGNLNYYKDYEKASSLQQNYIDVHDPIRYAQDYGIVFTTLCTDAAIQGGLYPSLAFTMRGTYIGKLEQSRTVPAVASVIEEMYDGFIREVRYGKKAANASPVVQKCCDYIHANLKRKITVAELADMAGYSSEHLSRVFSKELGISIKQYIERAKIEAVEKDLLYTELSIRELAEQYGYCSVSHMGKVFQKAFGAAPSEYRKAK